MCTLLLYLILPNDQPVFIYICVCTVRRRHRSSSPFHPQRCVVIIVEIPKANSITPFTVLLTCRARVYAKFQDSNLLRNNLSALTQESNNFFPQYIFEKLCATHTHTHTYLCSNTNLIFIIVIYLAGCIY